MNVFQHFTFMQLSLQKQVLVLVLHIHKMIKRIFYMIEQLS